MALGNVLKDYWGAVGRDLAVSGYTWDDVGSDRLPIDQFVPFVMHAPAGTATYFEINEGWTISDHLLAEIADAQHWLVWSKTKDARKEPPANMPKPLPRPKSKHKKKPEPKKPEERAMTVGEYMKKIGMPVNWGEEG